ncbi:MAG: hypothetical protein DME04_06350 [Candidatus Rokuibacteriota bacterium]|nr:MAG: hypothetical protein DME04_06350 [Candidatus Rokubacteria bacterium]
MIIFLLRRAFYYSLPGFVLGAIWFSLVDHYYVSRPTITAALIDQAREAPADPVLDELSGIRFFANEFAALDRAQTVAVAERILQGELALPGESPRKISLQFDPRDIDQGPPSWQLRLSTLVVPRVLLGAYRITGRDDFLFAARDMILGLASYERRTVLPKGKLWNDHAVAERMLALAEFWTLYRHHPRYDAQTARDVLTFVARSGRLLADPSHFTVATNHGVMQNLALWHLSVAFPSLPDASRYRQLALERLREQMAFYVNDEGVVLEHSAGYHEAGVQFLSLAFRYLSLLDIPIPAEWREKYRRAADVYAELRRPDGSLPVFGDTGHGPNARCPAVTDLGDDGRAAPLHHRADWSPARVHVSYPVTGYSVWWDGLQRWPASRELAQTVVAWSYFPGQAHKLADEMSVLLWARGSTWWTNVGYWPYGVGGRREAESWGGSNAPHLAGESDASLRTTRMLAEAATEGVAYIDLERKGPNGYTARRQVLHADKTLWLVLDHTTGRPGDRTTTVWTTTYEVTMSDGPVAASWELRQVSTGDALTAFIVGSAGTSARAYRGSEAPFVGWLAGPAGGRPASAIVVEQPANDAWAATVWSLSDDRPGARRVVAQPEMRAWAGPEKWTLLVPAEKGTVELSREVDKVFVRAGGARDPVHVMLARPESVDQKIAEIRASYQRAIAKYPPFRDVIDYRLKATYVVIGALLLQELFFAAYARLAGAYYTRGRYALLRGLSMIAWIGLGAWLVVIRERLI